MPEFEEVAERCKSAAITAISLLPSGAVSHEFSRAEAILAAVEGTVAPLDEVDVTWFLRMLHSRPDLFDREVEVTSIREACREAVVDVIVEQLEALDWSVELDGSALVPRR